MDKLDRRSFLGKAVLASAGVAAAGSASAQTPIARAGGARLKVSLNAYSFNKLLASTAKGPPDKGQPAKPMTLFDVLDFCAQQNFDAIDPTGYYFPGYPKVPADKFVNDFKRRAFNLGIDISGTGVRNHFASPDKQKRAADVQHVKEWIEVAARMGAPVIRVFAGALPEGSTFDQIAEWLVEELRKCVEHGQRYGVIVGVQNHGDTLQNADQVLKIVKQVDSEWFGVIVDTGLFLTPDPYKDVARVLPYAVNWQIKERIGKPPKEKLDLKKVIRIIKDGGYRGYVPIETLPAPGAAYDPHQAVPQFLKEVRAAIEQA